MPMGLPQATRGTPGTELLTGERAAGRLPVPAGAVRVVRLDG
ncbi:hypothetical protein [Streptomyces sp. NPDC048720]